MNYSKNRITMRDFNSRANLHQYSLNMNSDDGILKYYL